MSGDDCHDVDRTGPALVPVPLGRAALCRASVVQSASRPGACRPTAHVPGTAIRKIHKLDRAGSIRFAIESPSSNRAERLGSGTLLPEIHAQFTKVLKPQPPVDPGTLFRGLQNC